jgi:acetyl-CoA acetyltransferase
VKGQDRVAAVGVGYSTTGRRTGLASWQLAMQASQAAMKEAGMTAADIDGVALLWGVAGSAPAGLDVVEPMGLAQMLGIAPLNFYATAGPAYIGPAIQAISAIRSGLAHTVLTLRIINQRLSSADDMRRLASSQSTAVPGDFGFTAPYGFSVAGMLPSIAAMPAQRHMDLYGTTEEQFGAHAITQRYHASMNEEALFREPLTMDEYMASRYIAKPVHILDCDYPVDSASAVIYTAGDRARDWAKKPVWVESAAYSSIGYMTFDLIDMMENSPHHAARALWARTDLTPADVDCAQLYDGFSVIVFQWLEALGFCGIGEAGPFIEAGNTRLGGALPVNTDGGACNVGRRHGANFCIESIRQLRGESGFRQVPDAEVAVWANAAGPFSGAVLMTADRG